MIEAIVAVGLVGTLILGPLGWRIWKDRAEERAQAIRAGVQAAAARALGGESLLSVIVTPAVLWRRGRVTLAFPADWSWLVRDAWGQILDRVPDGYDVVLQAAPRPPLGRQALERAA